MAKVIRIVKAGLLANQMFQYLVAKVLQSEVPEAVVTGLSLPDFGIVDDADPRFHETEPSAHVVNIDGHVFPFREVVAALRRQPSIEIRIRYTTMRMEYLAGHVDLARRLFPIDSALGTGFDPRHLVMHVRAAEILRGINPNYTVLPIGWYRHLVEQTGLDPVFIGQIGPDRYSHALRAAFPHAQFIRHENPLADFNRLRTSVNVALSVSSFCWMATWLSETAQSLHVPIIGMYNPIDRPDIDLLPVQDRRCRFYMFQSKGWTNDAAEIEAKISSPAVYWIVRWPRLYRARLALALRRRGRYPVPFWRDICARYCRFGSETARAATWRAVLMVSTSFAGSVTGKEHCGPRQT